MTELKYFDNINKMPRLSKNQKIRRDTQKLLDELKSKLNPRTFKSFTDNITNKRIDVVKRLANNLKLLTSSSETNITKKTIVKSVDEVKSKAINKIQKLAYKQASFIPKINQFNKTGKSITITKLTPNKFKSIVNKLDLTKRVIIQAGNSYHTLTPENKNKFLDDIDKFFIIDGYGGIAGLGGAGSDKEYFSELVDTPEIIIRTPKWLGKSKNEGAFFNYYNNYPIIELKEFQIYTKKNDYQENCFVEALIQSKVLTDIEINDLRQMIKGKYVATKNFTEIANKFNLHIEVKHLFHNNKKKYGSKDGKNVVLGLIDKHYFIVKEVPYNMFAIQNIDNIKHLKNWNQIGAYDLDDKCYKVKKNRFTNSFHLIKYMYENKEKYFTPLPYEDYLSTQYKNEAPEITNLEYNYGSAIKDNTKPEPKENKYDDKVIFYDFETTTEGLKHEPYMVCNSETDCINGEKCGLIMMRRLFEKFYVPLSRTKDGNGVIGETPLKERRLILIAHNAGYDFCFLQQYLNLESVAKRGHNLLEAKGVFNYGNGKTIKVILKDSYSVITMPLANFGKCFGLPQSKEILPYNLYTKINVNKKLISIDDCKKCCDIQVRQNLIHKIPLEKDYDEYFNLFMKNCEDNDCIIVKPDDGGQEVKGETLLIDIIKYSKFYCEKDVEVLKLGYEKFDNILYQATGLNIINFMSSAQLAHRFMLDRGVFEGVKQLSSTPRDYIMKCMVGGRTMCAENNKHHKTGRIQDFDAVSLYPSAMSRLGGYLMGTPKIIEGEMKNYETLIKYSDGYFIQIKINKVNKNLRFPLPSYKNEDGVRTFSNDMIGKNIYVCKFELEDLIKYHKIEFDIIDGYYYNEGRNNKLKEVIDFVFNERLKMKKLKNPLEQIYKLIMNSSYGKTLQKAIDENLVFKTSDEIDNYVDKNYNYISKYEKINDDGNIDRYAITTLKGIEDHFNNCPCGVEVLAMSKRIMNEVMCLAEDLDIELFYQDTDSMHIYEEDIKTLAEKYEKVYKRVLIGKGMGQFHSDFDSNIIKTDIHATESIFLGKKCYIDKLEGKDEYGNNAVDYHIRMKGISNKSILYKSIQENKSLLEIYKNLLNGNKEKFDLACGGNKCCFVFNNDYTIKSKYEFLREVKF
jgi:hypothetical protein